MTYVKVEAGNVPSSAFAPLFQTTKFTGWYATAASIIGQSWQLELVSTLTKPDGSTTNIVDSRRGIAKTASVRGNVLSVQFADIDIAALSNLYPSKTYTVADFPELFTNHVGRPIPDGVGQLVQIPLVAIKKSGGQWRYAIMESRSGLTYTVQTVYRSKSEGQIGNIVTASEYTASTSTGAVSGVVVRDLIFTREQLDQGGAPYSFMADVLVSAGSGTTDHRLASREVARLLGVAGITVNAASFTTAHTYSDGEAMRIDAGYVKQRTVKAIIDDLLAACRGIISKNATGEWVLLQDKPTSVVTNYRETADLVSIDGMEYRDKPSSVSFFYRPKSSVGEDWLAAPRARNTGGLLAAKRYQNPYVYDHALADRLCDFLSKRDSILRRATVSVHAVQHDVREAITINAVTAWAGDRTWLIDGVRRPADKNVLSLREYDAAIYNYSSTTLPSGASNGYAPDYSYTNPAAPTALTYVAGSSGTTISTDGVTRAYMAYTVTAPTVNFARIVFVAIDAAGGIARIDGKLNGAVYEAVLSNLRAGVSHTIQAYAVNSNGLEGAVASEVRSSPGYAVTPNAPSGVGGRQIGTKTVQFDFVPSTSTNIDFYEAQIALNYGGYGAAFKVPVVFEYNFATVGVNIAARVRAVDKFGNASAYSGAYNIIPVKWADGAVIIDGSINQARSLTGTGSTSFSMTTASPLARATLDTFTFFPKTADKNSVTGHCYMIISETRNAAPTGDEAQFDVYWDGTSGLGQVAYVNWRKFTP